METISDNGGGGQCDCAEARYRNKVGETVPTGLRRHDCDLVKLKNSLIPQAAEFADRLVTQDERGTQKWSRLFNKRMEKLMRDRKGQVKQEQAVTEASRG